MRAEAQRAEWKRQVVEHNENLRSRDLVKMRDRGHGFSTAIHKGCGLDHDHVALRPASVPFLRIIPRKPRIRAQPVQHHEANIVSCSLIFAARIPEARNQANGRGCFVHVRSGAKLGNYFFASFSSAGGAAAAGTVASPSSFFAVITSGPVATSAATGSSSTVGATTEKTVKSADTRVVTPCGRGISRT